MSGVEGHSGPPGNQNSTLDKRLFANAVRRAAVQEDGKKLRSIVEKLFTLAEAGDVQATKEIADRLDGKPRQALEHSGPDGESLPSTIRVELVKPGA